MPELSAKQKSEGNSSIRWGASSKSLTDDIICNRDGLNIFFLRSEVSQNVLSLPLYNTALDSLSSATWNARETKLRKEKNHRILAKIFIFAKENLRFLKH